MVRWEPERSGIRADIGNPKRVGLSDEGPQEAVAGRRVAQNGSLFR